MNEPKEWPCAVCGKPTLDSSGIISTQISTPLLDELESGPWPQFVQDLKKHLNECEIIDHKIIGDKPMMEQKAQEQIEGGIHAREEHMEKVAEAFDIIKQAMIDDDPTQPGSYAHSWHCNIAMMCQDAIASYPDEIRTVPQANKIGNDAASRFMKICFDVETKA